MAATAVRDLHDWITGFGSLQERMRRGWSARRPVSGLPRTRLSARNWAGATSALNSSKFRPGALVRPTEAGRHVVLVGLGAGGLVGVTPGKCRAFDIRPAAS